MYSQDGFAHRIHEEVNIGAGSTRVYALLSPAEAEFLQELLSNTKADLSEREVDPESLDYRLGLAASGHQAPQSGQPEYYK